MPRYAPRLGTDRKLQAMSDPLHLHKIRAGAVVWNKWRRDNPSIVPDLNGLRISASELQFGAVQGGPVDFSRTELSQAVLVHATLIEANLAGAALAKADLSYARLNKADLRGADLRGAKLGYARPDRCPTGWSFRLRCRPAPCARPDAAADRPRPRRRAHIVAGRPACTRHVAGRGRAGETTGRWAGYKFADQRIRPPRREAQSLDAGNSHSLAAAREGAAPRHRSG